MKAVGAKLTVVATMVAGFLVTMPAHAGGGIIKVTHSATPYPTALKAAAAKAQPAATAKAKPQFQVGALAKMSATPAAKQSVYVHR